MHAETDEAAASQVLVRVALGSGLGGDRGALNQEVQASLRAVRAGREAAEARARRASLRARLVLLVVLGAAGVATVDLLLRQEPAPPEPTPVRAPRPVATAPVAALAAPPAV